MLIIFLDTETTGLNPAKHRTIEIAFRIFDLLSQRWINNYQALIFQPPEVWAEADPESLKINGFLWEDLLKNGKQEQVAAAEIIENINGTGIREKSGIFLCQNPSFDRAFFSQVIDPDLQTSCGWPYHWLDLASIYWSFRLFNDPASTKTLYEEDLSKDKIAAYLGLPPEVRPHRAMNGVNHLVACYERVLAFSARNA